MKKRLLFGGAVVMDYPSSSFVDISQVRQVPDNQEVYVDMSSNQSIIVEILEASQETTSEDSGSFHFAQLAQDNDATSIQVSTKSFYPSTRDFQNFPSGTSVSIVTGIQKIAKFGKRQNQPKEEDQVFIQLCTFRIPSIETDIVISWNIPNEAHDPRDEIDNSKTTVLDESNQKIVHPQLISDFHALISSFKVCDWSLFK